MALPSPHRLLEATRAGPGGDQPERQLLERFLARGEEGAFATLLERHGPMVLGVCRRVLGDAHEAEDAFQATFLILARRGHSVRKRESLASWLYGVAFRVSRRARENAARRRACERHAQEQRAAEPAAEVLPPDLRAVLDEELARLPEKYRAPVVLCYLQDKTNEEAARLLGWPVGSVKGRLARARDLLHARLTRRGVGLPAALTGAALGGPASAAVPLRLALATMRVVAPAGEASTAPASVLSLAEQAYPSTIWVWSKVAIGSLLLLAAVVGGAAALVSRNADSPPAPARARASGDAPQRVPAAPPRLDADGNPLPAGALARLGTTRFRHGGSIETLAYSPDGTLLASGGSPGDISLWDPGTGRLIRRLAGHEQKCQRVVFSPDGKLLASLGWEEAAITLWDPATGEPVRRLPGHPGPDRARGQTFTVAFTPDGTHLASTGGDTRTLLWEVATGKLVRQLPGGDTSPGTTIAFSPDGKLRAQGDGDGGVDLWDTATDREVRQLRPPGAGRTSAIAYSRDGRLLAVAATDRRTTVFVWTTVFVYDPATGQLLRQWPEGGPRPRSEYMGTVSTLAFSPDGRTLAAQYRRDVTQFRVPCIRGWDVETGQETISLEDHGFISGVAFSPDGKVLAGADGGSIRRWDAATGEELPPRGGHRDSVLSLCLSTDGKTLYTGGRDASVLARDLASGEERRNMPGHGTRVFCLLLTADGKTLGTASNDCLCLWDAATGRITGKTGHSVSERAGHPPDRYRFRTFGFTPDGRSIVTAWDREGLLFLDPATRKEQRQIAKDSTIDHLAFASDGRTLGTAGSTLSGHPQVRLWDAPTGRLLGENRTVFKTTALAFSPDRRFLATGSGELGNEPLVRLHSVPDGKVVRELRGHSQVVRAVVFSPDGRTVASASQDGTVRIWDVATGQERRRLEGHRGGVHAIAFTADGRTLVSGGDDTTVLLWDVSDLVPSLAQGRTADPD